MSSDGTSEHKFSVWFKSESDAIPIVSLKHLSGILQGLKAHVDDEAQCIIETLIATCEGLSNKGVATNQLVVTRAWGFDIDITSGPNAKTHRVNIHAKLYFREPEASGPLQA